MLFWYVGWFLVGLGIGLCLGKLASRRRPRQDTPGDTSTCRFFHRWESIEEAHWVGGIAAPMFLFTCKRCGASKIEGVGL